ncbi:MAG: TIR domain-containing protein, partial [Clostridiales bacterium]|nr:TIR domain-containing protein [Clostridiales bacterium]
MAILKCKMCGGDIIVNAETTYGTCDSCGSTMTLPKVSDDHRANMFNRANHFRRQNDFDKAATAYESILNSDDTDAEAHWGVVLSRYGIEYVEDPTTHERIPTCHRVQFESILADADYQAAIANAADAYTKSLYEKEAERIAEIQRGILAISANEKPYDVFICYKETDEAGGRTKDSTLAQDIYYQLTQEGYKVFFSRITLEGKLGTAYEPYIFAALNSAKVMVALGTSAANFNAVWVKNEWSRFLALMKRGRSRLLIPCYRDMDPYDLPEELSMLQSQDMGKIGFIQDLIRGIKKVLDAGKAPAQSAPQASTAAADAPGVASLLGRADIFLEDGDFKSADEYYDKVLDIDPKCAAAYWGKLKASLNTKNEAALIVKYTDLFNNTFSNISVDDNVNFSPSPEQEKSLAELKADPMLKDNDFAFLENLPLSYQTNEQGVLQAKAEYIENKNIAHNPNYQKALRFSDGQHRQGYE